MTSISQRIINARRQFMFDAAKRWQLLTQKRQEHVEKYQTVVADLIETPERVAKFRSREALRRKRAAQEAGSEIVPTHPSVGTLFQLTEQGARIRVIGNCILLPTNIILTNNHLIGLVEEAQQIGVEFDAPKGSNVGKVNFMVDPELLFISDKVLDITLIAINSISAEGVEANQLSATVLIEETGKVRLGDPLNLVQRNEKYTERYEGENNCLEVLDEGKFLYSTNAQYIRPGAGIFNRHWELVAMHQCGVPLVEKGRIVSDSSIGGTDIHEHNGFVRVGEQGVRVSSILSYLKAVRMMRPEKQQLLNSLLDKCKDPLTQPLSDSRARAPQTDVVIDKVPSELHLHGDIHIHIGANGANELTSLLKDSVPTVIEEEKQVVFDRDYSSRAGFDTEFLKGFSIPEPAVRSDLLAHVISDRDGEEMIFDYHHFSLSIEKHRRMPIWGACNVEHAEVQRGTEAFDMHSTDRLKDPRIKDTEQLNADEFHHARLSVVELPLFGVNQTVWGRDAEKRQRSFIDTMHWSNTYLVHESLKNAMDAGVWNHIERHLTTSLSPTDPKLIVFAGPLYDVTDPTFETDAGTIQIPLRAWKVVVVKDETMKGADIRAYGFMYDVSGPLLDLSVDRLDMHRYKTYQAQLSDISERSGVVFSDIIMAEDVMKSLSLGRRGRVVIEKLNDIVLRKRLRQDQLNGTFV